VAFNFDAISAGASSAVDADGVLTWTHTCGASANKLVVLVGSGHAVAFDRTVSAVTYNGVSLTLVGASDDGNFQRVEIWQLHNPPTGSAYTVSVTWNGAGSGLDLAGGSISFIDAAATLGTLYGDTNNLANPSVTVVDSASGDIVVSVMANDVGPDGNSTPGATVIYDREDVDLDSDYGAQYQTASGANTVASWTAVAPTSGAWAIAGVAVKAAAAGGGARISNPAAQPMIRGPM